MDATFKKKSTKQQKKNSLVSFDRFYLFCFFFPFASSPGDRDSHGDFRAEPKKKAKSLASFCVWPLHLMDECTVGRGRSTARVAFFVSLGFQSDDDCCCCCLDARLGVYRNVRSRTDHSPRSAGEQNETMRKLAHNLGTPNCPAVTEYELMSRTETIVHCAFATWTHWEDFFFFPLLLLLLLPPAPIDII